MLKRIAVIVLLFFWISALSVTFAKAGGGGVTGGATEVTQLANNVELAAIFGKETAGLPKELLERYPDRCFRIPMIEDARSLNLSNAVAVVAYEAIRQIGYKNLR